MKYFVFYSGGFCNDGGCIKGFEECDSLDSAKTFISGLPWYVIEEDWGKVIIIRGAVVPAVVKASS